MTEPAIQQQRPTGLELVDNVDQVRVGVDAKDKAVVDEGEGDGEGPDSALGPTVIDLESPVIEAVSEELPLVDGVGGRTSQGRLGEEFRMNGVDPFVESMPQPRRRSDGTETMVWPSPSSSSTSRA
jgi:hypothetical protein